MLCALCKKKSLVQFLFALLCEIQIDDTFTRHNYMIKEVPDFPDIDIRDEQTLSNTQREDWLLPTEPLHGAEGLAHDRPVGSALR